MTPLATQLIANLGQPPANSPGMNAPLSGSNDVNQAVLGLLMNKARAGQMGGQSSPQWGGLANIGSNLQGAMNWVGKLFAGAGAGGQ